jgi:hypothetical protein
MTEINYPLYLIFTKPSIPKYEILNFVCKTVDECYNKLIINIKNRIDMKIDYPYDLDEFSNIYWYKYYSMDNDIFDYNIFIDNEWKKPWSNQELYESVINILHNLDIQNAILSKEEEEII